jgi:alcohol dehydrogenase class IV
VSLDLRCREATSWMSLAPRELRFGPGAVDGVAHALLATAGRRPLVVTDRCVLAAGWPDMVARLLGDAGTQVSVWDGVSSVPDEAAVHDCRDAARAGRHDVLVAVGGGSVIDTAKACSGLIGNGGCLSDYEGLDLLTEAGPPVVAVLTTPGSGAEASRHAVISADTGRRFAVSGRWLSPGAVVADPRLSVTAPRDVLIDAAIDSLIHAIEAFLARAATPLSDLFAQEAVSRITRSAVPAVSRRDELALTELALGCLLAGLAMANTNAGIVHALGYPLSREHGLPHARANAAVAPAALHWLHAAGARRQDRLLGRWEPACAADPPPSIALAVQELLAQLGVPAGLEAHGVPRAELRTLARLAASYGPVLRNTPVAVYGTDLLAVYEAAWPSPRSAAAGPCALQPARDVGRST